MNMFKVHMKTPEQRQTTWCNFYQLWIYSTDHLSHSHVTIWLLVFDCFVELALKRVDLQFLFLTLHKHFSVKQPSKKIIGQSQQ